MYYTCQRPQKRMGRKGGERGKGTGEVERSRDRETRESKRGTDRKRESERWRVNGVDQRQAPISTYIKTCLCRHKHTVTLTEKNGRHGNMDIGLELANFFCNGSESKYLRLRRPYGFHRNSCVPLLQYESGHRQA